MSTAGRPAKASPSRPASREARSGASAALSVLGAAASSEPVGSIEAIGRSAVDVERTLAQVSARLVGRSEDPGSWPGLAALAAQHGGLFVYLQALLMCVEPPGMGHLEDPELTVTLPFDVAKGIFIEGNPQAGMQAFMAGKIKVQGDMTKLMAMQSAGAPSPEQVAFQEKIKALTA